MNDGTEDDDQLSIGEFARAASLSVSAVRFYADRGILLPATTDSTTGYRYFAEAQVATAALVRDLRRIEMPLAEIAEVLALAPADREAAVDAQIGRLEQRLTDARLVAASLGGARVGTGDPTVETTLRARDLQHAITQVVPMAGRDPRAPHLMVVLVELRNGSLRLVATDRYRMTVRDLALESVGESFAGVVAAAALMEWTSLPVEGIVSLSRSGVELVAEAGEVERRCPVVPVDFPAYHNVLRRSASANTTVVVDRSQWLAMLEAFDGEEAVLLDACGDELISTRDGHSSCCPADITGTEAQVAVNPRFATEAVEHAVGAEVVIELGGPSEPVTFRSADAGTYTSLLMPVVV